MSDFHGGFLAGGTTVIFIIVLVELIDKWL
jgi:hypothetical protein